MICNTKKMLLEAVKYKYAVPHFNIHNLENARAVVEVAHELRSPVVLACTPGTFAFSGLQNVIGLVRGLAQTYPETPIAIHMDHHQDFAAIEAGIKAGVTSVMIDLSQKSFEENVRGTKRVVELARKYDVTVEAELGALMGVEDDLVVTDLKGDPYTKADAVVEFIDRTGIDSLAIAIGTLHGLYKQRPQLNYARLTEIRALTDTPLILHGASGLTDQETRKCVELGINKVNIATELKEPYLRGIIDHYKAFASDDLFNPKLNDPRALFAGAITNIKAIIRRKILLCKADKRY